MPDKKPSCDDFIIAAIRTLRSKPSSAHPETQKGVRLVDIWSTGQTVYTDKQFRAALNRLMKESTVVITHRNKTFNKGYGCPKPLYHIPKDMPLDKDSWYEKEPTDSQVDPVETDSDNLKRTRYWRHMVYVAEDGLPIAAKTAPPSERLGHALAQQIIAGMKKP